MKRYIIYILLISSICLSAESGTGFIKNLILPGWGFIDNQEHKAKAKGFLLREIIIWSSLFTSRGISDVYEDSYIGYGIDYANTMKQSMNNLQDMLGADGMKGLAAETKRLVAQQKKTQ